MGDNLDKQLATLSDAVADIVDRDVVIMTKARLAAIYSVLRPFSEFAASGAGAPDSFAVTQRSLLAKRQLTVGDCRRARDLLQVLEEAHG